VSAVADRLAAIALEVENNRLEEPGSPLQTRLVQEIAVPLRSLAEEQISWATSSLNATRRQTTSEGRAAALAAAIDQQTAVLAKMKGILDHMVKSESFQEAVNLLYEIQKAQTQVLEQTDKERQERIKRILEGEKPATPRRE